ncbi:MAG: hypothetical protein KGZ58_00490 [Ignavibacteriales bacterium]|nr:hypothetical protein [Ignavibacteriales bacterium]
MNKKLLETIQTILERFNKLVKDEEEPALQIYFEGSDDPYTFDSDEYMFLSEDGEFIYSQANDEGEEICDVVLTKNIEAILLWPNE